MKDWALVLKCGIVAEISKHKMSITQFRSFLLLESSHANGSSVTNAVLGCLFASRGAH